MKADDLGYPRYLVPGGELTEVKKEPMKTYKFELFLTIPEKARLTLFQAILRIVEAIGGQGAGTVLEISEGIAEGEKDEPQAKVP